MPRGGSKSGGAVELDIFLEKLQVIPASPAFSMNGTTRNPCRVTNFVNPCASLNGFVSQSRGGFAYCMELFYIDISMSNTNGTPTALLLDNNTGDLGGAPLGSDFIWSLDTIKYFNDGTTPSVAQTLQLQQSPTNIDYTVRSTFGVDGNFGVPPSRIINRFEDTRWASCCIKSQFTEY